MTLHLIRLDPDAAASARWFAAEKLPAKTADDGYAWHALLTAVFGKSHSPKPFRIMARRGRPIQLLAYTKTSPSDLHQLADEFADPLAREAIGMTEGGGLASKPMPAFALGRRLGISLLVRPTVRTDREGDRTKTAEIDAFLAAWRAAGERPDRHSVYSEWTSSRLQAGGCRVLGDLQFDGLERAPVMRRDSSRLFKQVEGHAATVTGQIEVTDPDAFAALLARGVGRHRAFGYGMLLLSPP